MILTTNGSVDDNIIKITLCELLNGDIDINATCLNTGKTETLATITRKGTMITHYLFANHFQKTSDNTILVDPQPIPF